MSYSFS